MAVTVTVTPSSGTAVETAFHIQAAGLDDRDMATYSSGVAYSPAEIRYYFQMSEGGTVKGRSAEFAPDSGEGKGVWLDVICPDAGTYVFSIKKSSDNATVGSTAVTVA